MSKNKSSKFILTLAIIAVVFIAIGALVAYYNSNSSSGDRDGTPIISLAPASIDWGTLSAAQGVVSKEFNVTNNGDADLIIKKISTSCGCTTAILQTAKRSTPKLGMDHGKLPRIEETIVPGETAKLIVTFDPDFHYVRGPVTRVVYIQSNDPVNQEVEAVNKLTVTD